MVAGLLATSNVAAQPGASAPPSGGNAQPVTVDGAPLAPPPAPADPPEVEARFQDAISALIAGRYGDAAAHFEEVALRSSDPLRQTTAAEMARQSRDRLVASERDRRAGRSRDGRYLLVGGAAMVGLTLYGPTLPILVEPDDDKTVVGLYMLGAGGTFFGAWMLTRDRPVSMGTATAWIHGSTRGILHGVAALAVIDRESSDDKAIWGTLTLASMAEGTGFALWADHVGATTGLVNTMGHVSDVAGLAGLGLAHALVGETVSGRTIGAAGLIGSGLGYGLGYAYARARNPTWGDGEVLRSATLLGAYTAILPLIYAGVDNERVYSATLVAGAAAGLYVGDHLLEGRDFTPGQGIVTELSPLAGGLVGAGLGYLISPDDGDSAGKIIATGGALGGLAGFALAYAGLDTYAQAGSAPGARSATTFQLTPDLRPDHKGLALTGTF